MNIRNPYEKAHSNSDLVLKWQVIHMTLLVLVVDDANQILVVTAVAASSATGIVCFRTGLSGRAEYPGVPTEQPVYPYRPPTSDHF